MAESWVAAEVDMVGREPPGTGFRKSIVWERRCDLRIELLLSRVSGKPLDDKMYYYGIERNRAVVEQYRREKYE